MKAKELAEILLEHPEAKVSTYGIEFNNCGNDYDYFNNVEVDFNEKDGIFYIISYED